RSKGPDRDRGPGDRPAARSSIAPLTGCLSVPRVARRRPVPRRRPAIARRGTIPRRCAIPGGCFLIPRRLGAIPRRTAIARRCAIPRRGAIPGGCCPIPRRRGAVTGRCPVTRRRGTITRRRPIPGWRPITRRSCAIARGRRAAVSGPYRRGAITRGWWPVSRRRLAIARGRRRTPVPGRRWRHWRGFPLSWPGSTVGTIVPRSRRIAHHPSMPARRPAGTRPGKLRRGVHVD
ncbi:MAG: hypothetical protein QOK20_1692, partial [Acidimicrobiaceae bacterium]|nr:hypothetical protein [Acidimicrobiaceae bacterium]